MVMERDVQPSDSYIKKLNALLPAEVTGLYLFLRSLTRENWELYPWLGATVLIIVVVLYVFAPQILKISKPVTRILYCITFILWVSSIEVFVLADHFGAAIAFIVPAAVAIWTFVLPPIFDGMGG
jgi:hypothetical protein